MKRMNIMTSCDNNLAQWIPTQITSIGVNLHEYDVHFYLFHYRITAENISAINDYCNTFENITFHEIIIQNLPLLEKLAEHGGNFPPEAYAWLHCHEQFPTTEERVIYIDAGDIIIHGDISEYYFADFEGKSFVATPINGTFSEPNGTVRLLGKDDLSNRNHAKVFRDKHISSGTVVINLEKFRINSDNIAIHYQSCINYIRTLKLEPIPSLPGAEYLGDQGFAGLAFAGDIKLFGYEEVLRHVIGSSTKDAETVDVYKNATYLPYNLPQVIYANDTSCWYIPVILHYGATLPKPWTCQHTIEEIDTIDEEKLTIENLLSSVTSLRQLELRKIWQKYHETTFWAYPPPRRTIVA